MQIRCRKSAKTIQGDALGFAISGDILIQCSPVANPLVKRQAHGRIRVLCRPLPHPSLV